MGKIHDKATAIRTELKEKYGITSRQVSIRMAYCGYSESIHLTIKNLAIPATINEVEEIANKFRFVQRDENDEIIEGINTFVYVDYNMDAMKEEEKKYSILSQKIIDYCNSLVDTSIIIAENDDFELYFIKDFSNSRNSHIDIKQKESSLRKINPLKFPKKKSFGVRAKDTSDDINAVLVTLISIYHIFDLSDFKI